MELAAFGAFLALVIAWVALPLRSSVTRAVVESMPEVDAAA